MPFYEPRSKFNSSEIHKQHGYLFCFVLFWFIFDLRIFFFLKFLILVDNLFFSCIHSNSPTHRVPFFLRHAENPRSPWVLFLTWSHISFLLFRKLSALARSARRPRLRCSHQKALAFSGPRPSLSLLHFCLALNGRLQSNFHNGLF